MVNRLLSQIDMNCSGPELNNFIEPLHRWANEELGSAKFLNTPKGQLGMLALATFGPKIPKGIKAIRGKFSNRNIRNVETGENLPVKQESRTADASDLHRSDGTVLRGIDFHADQRPAAIL